MTDDHIKMNSGVKIFQIQLKFWWIGFGLCHLIIAILQISSLGTKEWVSADYSETSVIIYYSNPKTSKEISRYFDGSLFSGSLSFCKKGCDNKDSFSVLTKDWCDDLIKDEYKRSEIHSEVESVCTLFMSLSGGSSVFIIFEVASLVSLLIWFISMICLGKAFRCYYPGCCCSICSCVSHFIAILFWFTITGATFSSCSSFPDDGRLPVVCAETGPILGLVILSIFPFFLLSYIAVSVKLRKKSKELSIVPIIYPNTTNMAPTGLFFNPTNEHLPNVQAVIIQPVIPIYQPSQGVAPIFSQNTDRVPLQLIVETGNDVNSNQIMINDLDDANNVPAVRASYFDEKKVIN